MLGLLGVVQAGDGAVEGGAGQGFGFEPVVGAVTNRWDLAHLGGAIWSTARQA